MNASARPAAKQAPHALQLRLHECSAAPYTRQEGVTWGAGVVTIIRGGRPSEVKRVAIAALGRPSEHGGLATGRSRRKETWLSAKSSSSLYQGQPKSNKLHSNRKHYQTTV